MLDTLDNYHTTTVVVRILVAVSIVENVLIAGFVLSYVTLVQKRNERVAKTHAIDSKPTTTSNNQHCHRVVVSKIITTIKLTYNDCGQQRELVSLARALLEMATRVLVSKEATQQQKGRTAPSTPHSCCYYSFCCC